MFGGESKCVNSPVHHLSCAFVSIYIIESNNRIASTVDQVSLRLRFKGMDDFFILDIPLKFAQGFDSLVSMFFFLDKVLLSSCNAMEARAYPPCRKKT